MTTTAAMGMMNHSMMNHSMMDHSMMNHSMMNHGDHSMMNHGAHAGHDMSGNSTDHSHHNQDGGHQGHAGPHSDHDMMGMKMYFHTGVMEYVLFESCMTETDLGMFAACAVVFLIAVLYEGLKFLREVMLQKSLALQSPISYIDKNNGHTNHEQIVLDSAQMSVVSRMFSKSHFIQTVLHVMQVFISYCLMLVFMTYNVWLCLAVILGAGVGYFAFGWKRAVVVDANEHCH